MPDWAYEIKGESSSDICLVHYCRHREAGAVARDKLCWLRH